MVTIPKHVLDLQLKGPQLVSIHAKTVSKQSILTQRDELQRRVDKWGLGNSQALFTACSNGVFNFFIANLMRNREQNTHNALEHLQSGPYQTRGIMSTERAVKEKRKSKGVRIHQRGTFQEQKVRSDACFAPAIHNAHKHTDRNMS